MTDDRRDPTNPAADAAAPPGDAGLSLGVKILLVGLNLVFSPVIGLLWYLIIRKDKPRTARSVARVTWLTVAIVLFLGLMVLAVALLFP